MCDKTKTMATEAETNKNDKKQRKLTKSPQISCEINPPMTGRSMSPSSWSLYGTMNIHTTDAEATPSNASFDSSARDNAFAGTIGTQPKKPITPENQSSTIRSTHSDYR